MPAWPASAGDSGQLPDLMSTLMAVSDHLDDPPPRLAEALSLVTF